MTTTTDLPEPTANALGAVYARAARLISERGFCHEYTYRTGAPLDLGKAVALAARELQYPVRWESPSVLLSDWRGQLLHDYGRTLDAEGAMDFLEDAMLAAGDILAGVALPVEEKPKRICEACEQPIVGERGRSKFHAACRPPKETP